MVENMSHNEAKKVSELPMKPEIMQQIDEIPSVEDEHYVVLEKVDSQTGVLRGVVLQGWLMIETGSGGSTKIMVGKRIFLGNRELRGESYMLSTSHTSIVASVGLMNNGSYWIRTENGSVYRFSPEESQQAGAAVRACEMQEKQSAASDDLAGAQKDTERNWMGILAGLQDGDPMEE